MRNQHLYKCPAIDMPICSMQMSDNCFDLSSTVCQPKRDFIGIFEGGWKCKFTSCEVPGSAWANLQPAEHILFCKYFSKTLSFSFKSFRLPGPGGSGGRSQNCTKTFLRQVGMCMQILSRSIQGFGFPLALATYQQTSKHSSLRPFIYI